MSFALDRTHISGGTFNNVSGNMTQVIHSHPVHLPAPVGPRLMDGGPRRLLPPGTTGDAMGPSDRKEWPDKEGFHADRTIFHNVTRQPAKFQSTRKT
ncbi:hypothetical protein B0H10DRAFT_253523 [Mycena sp. CBHHK59/15]|nr:hypothetical protein B0H10DRAFT_253523 [Mycena sp. CBHHK59/15]